MSDGSDHWVPGLSMTEIRAFNATVQEGNFSRAALYLGVSQPAVTAQIRKLEARFDTPLLERFNQTIKLTHLGQQLYRITRQYRDLESSIQSLIAPPWDARPLEVRLATASPLVFMPLITAFSQAYPDSTLKITSGTTDECRDLVLAREVDLGLFPLPDSEPGLSRLAFHSHQLVAVIHPDNRLAAESSVSVHQLANEALIFSRNESFTQKRVNEVFARAGLFPTSNILMNVRADICEAVAHGLGVGFALSHDIRSDDARYRAVPVKEAAFEVHEHLVWLKSRTHLPEVQHFVGLAIESRR
ncbi:MAG: hypothetical protein CMI01_00825 [Oceanospirillaceae bacterium]|nr:hypothetical protein [Oceanospirillaceae bacterium]